MKIDGNLIAEKIKSNLKEKTKSLSKNNIIPHLAVILIGDDPSSLVYVARKEKVGAEIGAKVTVFKEQKTYNRQQLSILINKLNSDNLVHGIIIQRPVPIDITKEELDKLVLPNKDVDGFYPNSPFNPPIASAVLKILEFINKRLQNNPYPLNSWLKTKKILVIGRGETAGKPIAETLQKMGIKIEIAHSKTTNIKELSLASDIIITCAGRPDIVRRDMVGDKTILIGVGLHQEGSKLSTDYNLQEIAEKVAFYTPVPGGVGPVNVACLFENLITSCGISGGFL